MRHLVLQHERPGGDAERSLLSDADALSFFSLNSSGFLRYFSAEHTRRKVAYTLARLRPEHHRRLREMRLAPALRALLDVQLASAGAAREGTG